MLSKDYVLGFVEGEGCFSIAIGRFVDRRPRKNVGKQSNIKNPYLFQVKPMFVITNVESSLPLFEEMRSLLGVGRIYIAKRKTRETWQSVIQLRVQKLSECFKIVDFFKEMPFGTTKGEDFKKWAECLEIIRKNGHITREGLLRICQLRDSMNFRKTKSKWTTEEVTKILDAKPIHQVAHFDPDQQPLIHNKDDSLFNMAQWLEAKQGNSKPSRLTSP
jgi:hypothetical protein